MNADKRSVFIGVDPRSSAAKWFLQTVQIGPPKIPELVTPSEPLCPYDRDMNNRRSFLGSLAAAQSAPLFAAAQTNRNHAETIHRQPLPPPFEGWEAEFVSVTMVPGPGYAPHHHEGFVLGYVVDGAFRFAVDGEPERVLQPCQVFYEPPGANHTVSASGSPTRDARILAIIISNKAKKGDLHE